MAIGSEISGRYRFRLDRWIGGGAFGGVYEARVLEGTPEMPPRVAVKVLNATLCDKARKHAVQRELSSLLAIHNRRTPRVFDGAVDRVPFIAMELFTAGTLSDMQRRVGALDEGDGWNLLDCLLEGLGAAHTAGVLHLDVKPSNVLLDGDGGFVLADFGVSQASRLSDLPMAGLGSVGWQSPEQATGDRVAFDLRTDVFGAGLTVWSALTGLDLAARDGGLMIRRSLKSKSALPPISFVRLGGLDPALDAIVASMIARDPDERPGSALALLARVRAARRGDKGEEDQPPGAPVSDPEARSVLAGIVDPLVVRMLGTTDPRGMRRLAPTELLCRQGERSHFAFILLKGALRVIRDGTEIDVVSREGELVGEIAALTGERRGAALVAAEPTWVRVFDAAQIEALVAGNPALAVRLLRTMAARFHNLEARR